jgi:hypothetical protein
MTKSHRQGDNRRSRLERVRLGGERGQSTKSIGTTDLRNSDTVCKV